MTPLLLTSLIFLLGLFALSCLASALRKLHERDSALALKEIGNIFFFHPVFSFFFPEDDYEGILFSVSAAQTITGFICLVSGTLFGYLAGYSLPLVVITMIVFYMCSNYIPRIIGSVYPAVTLATSSFISSPFLLLSFPLAALFIKISRFSGAHYFEYFDEPMREVKHEIFQILQEAKLSPKLTLHDKKLIESVIYFQNRIAREVMVPRINIFSLDRSTTIREAVKLLEEEGYSRVPVYKDTIDQIAGVLMYKDILTKYIEYQEKGNDPAILEMPIVSIVKPVMYAPETKKISNLLQDFRKKQMHLAIIVDEYGGTAGIVTIEDILEEIVGEIEDEYDDEEDLFHPLTENVWIVDAKMSIIDAKEQLKISLPQEGDYDTIGGYIFHRAGTIPSKGFTIKLDTIELEVLKSNDRKVEKVKIKRKKEI
jgi:putative hemolysin